MMKGKLITLEGLDGCGKSTHAKLLANWLRDEGHEVEITDEPTDNPIGKILKKALRGEIEISLETEALLFAGDRALHVADDIGPALEGGKIVITERYIYSSLAYQTARGLSDEWVKSINKPAIDPDLAIVIDVPAEVGFERIKTTRELDTFEQDLDLQKRVRERYKEIVKGEGIIIVDGTREVDKVQSEIREQVKEVLHADLSG
ncbi:hypothetical protein AKJ35_01215 [candidate division MSBL1 archaeon SCGC-AAA833F18]|uniref:Probable thymidylate kinase n=3 Tax=candidate division MSBL1 TaxID=215777 RepID=A0A133V2F8_9EURY|nr:hypothetical protein AKJ42_00215 [candidate division MSBL1 archaeon SCGC-AAA261C02]KXB04982.1 hypothetical protein AKJ48_00610 [candidate division MSBL1 archaeon SCGC-AAA261O19]KXB09219.1 hypothetical protein AKJ35_01215 [candidate division MSBL1 archaeon SCGC-AAA833F18]